eukprot:TRINITY_DN3113_c0_g1_i1.p1 TRINITY_DN3113_c0_g1~~TRINITY_DN3113_c0_g1_i1.p1  ORF type:complete len:357 (+),score=54.63 TRINITY_DN3113_c0_g1_i1:84-1154(+)
MEATSVHAVKVEESDANGEVLKLMLPAQAFLGSKMQACGPTAKVGTERSLTLPSTPYQAGQTPVFTPLDKATTAWRTQVCPNAPRARRGDVMTPTSVSGVSTGSNRAIATRLFFGNDDGLRLSPKMLGLAPAMPFRVGATPCNVPSPIWQTQECHGAPGQRGEFGVDAASAGSTPRVRRKVRSVTLRLPHSARLNTDDRFCGRAPLERGYSHFRGLDTSTSGPKSPATSPAHSSLNRGFLVGSPTCADRWLSGRLSFFAPHASSPFCVDMTPISFAAEYAPAEESHRSALDTSESTFAHSGDRDVTTFPQSSIESSCVQTSAASAEVLCAKGKIEPEDSFDSADEEPPLWLREIGA